MLRTITKFEPSHVPGFGPAATCQLECGHSVVIRVQRSTRIVPGRSRARCNVCTRDEIRGQFEEGKTAFLTAFAPRR